MIPEQIEQLCAAKEQELLDKYFGNIIYEDVVLRPETIGEYTKDLPLRIEAEYFEFLKRLWEDVRGEDLRSLDDLLDKRHLRMLTTEDARESIGQAYDNAVQITLWERLTKSNHKDIAFYKGLLKEYVRELLRVMTADFLEDVKNKVSIMSLLESQINQALHNHQTIVEIAADVTSDDVRNCIKCIMRRHPEIFWYTYQYDIDLSAKTICLQYTFSAGRTNLIQQSIEDVIANDFCIDYVRTLSQKEQVAYIYKWLITYCVYNAKSAYNQSIYSVFVHRNSVCTGYAKAAQYLFNLLGLESQLVFGRLNSDKNDGRHCWNIVQIEDCYYHFDACLGNRVLDKITKMSGGNIFNIDDINWAFFCLSTNEIAATRSIEDKNSLPDCPCSLSESDVHKLSDVQIKQRHTVQGCLLSNIGSSADIYLCSQDKNVVLKVFRGEDNSACVNEYRFMQQLKGCKHILQCNDTYTDIKNNIIAIEQSVSFIDLLYSNYYELSLKGLLKMAIDIGQAWLDCRQQGVLYRDIHICNIYRANDGIYKLGDFGSCTNDFNTIEIVGNQWFMAPETYFAGIFTEASAVYSIAMVIYFVLNGLRPPFWMDEQHLSESLSRKMRSKELPPPLCFEIAPSQMIEDVVYMLKKATSHYADARVSMSYFIQKLQHISQENSDMIIHKRCYSPFGFNNTDDFYITNYEQIRKSFDDRNIDIAIAEREALTTIYTKHPSCDSYEIDYVEHFATTMACNQITIVDSDGCCNNIVADMNGDQEVVLVDIDGDGTFDLMAADINGDMELSDDEFIDISEQGLTVDDLGGISDTDDGLFASNDGMDYTESDGNINIDTSTDTNTTRKVIDYVARIQTDHEEQGGVQASVFAPAEVRRNTHLLVQVYLHLSKDIQTIVSLAAKSDKSAEQRDYIPLQLKLKYGDKVDIDFNIYGSNCLINARKSMIWQEAFDKCSFNYFVPMELDVDQLCCEIILSVGGIPVGEMHFLTDIVEYKPRKLHPDIISHTFKKIFISYAHEDSKQVRNFALAYKAQGVDYFFDRDKLEPGDIYEEKIFHYIDNADLFILCWSANAAKSEYVAKEKERAMRYAYPQISLTEARLKIFPISIEPRAELPADMRLIYNFIEL